ncbi:DUF2911 domain-containing protein [Weeksellaceae bacterium KMM 9724]|uniref:DUF2911 domain-containing protein n=1 Tax=Profundicola chukchiensis TaxID=2961959 RepID=UPI002440BC95|nr:DUF2911 domain-containing protein [Profundicola chukchiensis]MDG4951084.1 DUF2911 domain-containing protein [Profundicola chukchiensis]
MKKTILSAAIIFGLAFTNAQVKTPQPSPAASVTQTVGLTEITVDYSRPSAKERKIFGDIVPLGSLWRTGANSATSIEFSTEVKFGGESVKPGKYAIYTVPRGDQWEVYLYSDTEVWGAPKELDKKLVVVATKAPSQKMEPRVESFTIGFDDLRDKSANLVMAWENTMVKVPIAVEPHEEVMKSIKSTMSKDPSANDFAAAGTYFYQNNMELKTALEYMTKALDASPKAFWHMSTKAEIQAALGDYKGAMKTAEEALGLAKEADYAAYIQKNEENLKKWQNAKKK